MTAKHVSNKCTLAVEEMDAVSFNTSHCSAQQTHSHTNETV